MVILKWLASSASGERTNQVKVTNADQFELKGQVRELFEELGRISEGMVIQLEFRHGLPFSLEITPIVAKPEPC